jgi:hypothetical protein
MTHSPDITEECAIYPAAEWTLLPAPPADANQLLALIASQERFASGKSAIAKEAWFRSVNGTVRYCRYTRSTDPCDGGPEHFDFEFYYGKWNLGGGMSTICIAGRKTSVVVTH